jgi:hypothetical protein
MPKPRRWFNYELEPALSPSDSEPALHPSEPALHTSEGQVRFLRCTPLNFEPALHPSGSEPPLNPSEPPLNHL